MSSHWSSTALQVNVAAVHVVFGLRSLCVEDNDFNARHTAGGNANWIYSDKVSLKRDPYS